MLLRHYYLYLYFFPLITSVPLIIFLTVMTPSAYNSISLIATLSHTAFRHSQTYLAYKGAGYFTRLCFFPRVCKSQNLKQYPLNLEYAQTTYEALH